MSSLRRKTNHAHGAKGHDGPDPPIALPRPMLLLDRAPVVSLETSPAATMTPIRTSGRFALRVAPHNPGRDERGRDSKLLLYSLHRVRFNGFTDAHAHPLGGIYR